MRRARRIGQPTAAKSAALNFDSLVHAIVQVHEQLQFRAAKAVDVHLTLRNWLIGCRIREYELKGKDRATYGEKLFDLLAARLTGQRVSNCDRRQLYRYRDFYLAFPNIVGTASPQLLRLRGGKMPLGDKAGTSSPQLALSSEDILNRLSYSHFEELSELDDPLKRAFYEVECVRGNWSVRELRRQMASLYFERSGLSKDKNRLSQRANDKAQPLATSQIIRDPYVFEFLGLKPKEVMAESDLEDALLDKLENFLLELGHGFCFEARQKRVVIGGKRLFVDLVFYHRILKCHVLIELKVDDFNHEHLGQLNTYVNWYRKHEMAEGDNLPVGILLCTKKNHALVEYALAGIDNRLFVSKYQLELPRKDEIRRFIEKQIESAVATRKPGHGG